MKNHLLILSICFTLALSFLNSKQLNATHLMGGEITWECQSNGEYLFTFKVYRDCSGASKSAPEFSGLIQIHNYPNTGQVTQIPSNQWTQVSNSDIAPNCGATGFSCSNGDPEAVFEYVRQFSRRLNGTPPAAGWIITYDDVARNANDNIFGQPGVTLRAKILPHSGSVADTCIDNSPKFREIATSLVCTGLPFKYNHNATDDELDSLVFEWAKPLNAIGTNQLYVEGSVPTPVSFQSGFSYTSPFPGPSLDPRNVPATLDPNTGEINLTSYTQGKYVSVVKVTAYKCGGKVAEVYRELQSNLANSTLCSNNDAPIIRPPFRDANGNYTLWSDTIRAGALINFPIQVQDFASVAQRGGDSITLTATGFQFGTNYTSSTTGCLNPPCATLNTSLPQKGFVGVGNNFSWQTDCQHTSFTDRCVSGQNTYTFVFTAVDDVCPLPLKSIATVSITVLADSVITSPLIHCVDVQANGDVNLDWNITPDPNNSFSAWMIYSATDENGPYSIVDSIKTYSQGSYTHLGAGADSQRRWYYIRSRSGCKGIVQNVARDTVSTIFVEPILTESCIGANWNPLSNPNPSGSAAQYNVYREYPIGSGFSLQTSTAVDSLCETFTACKDSVAYRIELVNSTESCTSTSNTLVFKFDRTPQTDFSFTANPCKGVPINFTNLTTAVGGTPSYTWDFGDGSPTSTATNPTHTYSGIGPFTVTLTASNGVGCDSVISKQISLGPDVSAGPDTVLCPGNSVQIGGPASGVSPLTFSWSPTATLNNPNTQFPSASPTTTTTYTLTVTDGNGCSNTDQAQVTVVPNPSADAGADRTICAGDDIMIGGAPTGPSAATFQWNNAATLDDPSDPNPMASPTVTTTYTVTVSVGNNCTDTDQMTVTVNPSPTADAGVDENICEGSSVQLGATASGGAGGFSYSWSPTTGLSNPNIQQPIANPTATTTYTVTVTDALGCTDDDQMTVNVNDQPNVDFNFSDLCEGDQTQFTDLSTVNSGTLSTWTWDFGDGIGTSTQQNPTYQYASAGSYTVELVVSSTFGCKDSITKNVTIAPPPTTDAGADDDICAGDNIQIGSTAISGYTYAWDNAATLSSPTVSNPTATPTATTTYTVTVTETVTGCTNTDQVTITVNPLPTADAGADQSICESKSVQIGSAAVGGYTYAWDNGASLSSAIVADPIATPLSTTTYTVTVTETATSCTNTDQLTITVNDVPTADFTFSDLCEGDQTQFTDASSIASGSISSWTWDFGDGSGTSTQQNPTYQYASSGTYTVELIVESALACADTISKSVTIEPLPTADAGANQTICDRDTVQIGTASTVGYSYAWNNAASLSNASISNPNAFPSISTTYTVTVTDNSTTCTATDQVVVIVNAVPSAAFTYADTCFGSTTTFDGSPSAAASYSWDFGDGSGTSTQEDPTYTYTATGTYTVKLIVENGSGCKDSISRTIEIRPLPIADAGADDDICAGDNIQIGSATISGYTYAWNNAATLSSASIADPTATPTATTTYTVTVTETATGCTNTDQVTITVNPLPTADAGPDQSICENESIQIGTAAIGGNTYAWDNGASLSSATIAEPTATPLSTTTYTVTVTETATGCTNTDQVTVTVNDVPTADFTFSDLCEGDQTQFTDASSIASGSISSWTWNFGDGSGTSTQQNPTYQYASAGTYTVELIVESALTCADTISKSVTIEPLPTADAGADQTICDRDTVQIGTASTAGYTYAWDNASSLSNASISNPNAFPSATTTYTVTVTESATTCTATDQVTITVNPLAVVDFTYSQACLGDATQFTDATSIVSGNLTSWTWDFGDGVGTSSQQNPTYTYTSAGSYSVSLVVGSDQGCIDSIRKTVIVDTLPIADAGTDQTICAMDTATLGGLAISGLTYAWDNAVTLDDATAANPKAFPMTNTTYSVTVTDGNGCTDTDEVDVSVNDLPTVDAGPDQSTCVNDSVQIGGSPTGATAISYSWTPTNGLSDATAANPMASPQDTTKYFIEITDANGCVNIDSVTVFTHPLPQVDFTVDEQCLGNFAAFTDQSQIAKGSISSWDWNFGDGSGSSTLQNPAYEYSTAGIYDVTLIVSSALGCIDSITKQVEIYDLPEIDAGGSIEICYGDTIELGGNPTGPTGATYSWSPSTDLSDVTAMNPMAYPLTTTNYALSVSDANGCLNYDTAEVQVNPLPDVVASPDTAICIDNPVQLNATGAKNYSWQPSTFLDDPQISNPTSIANKSVTYVVFGTDAKGCLNTDTVEIDVFNLDFSTTDTSICYGDSVALIPMLEGDTTGIQYYWSPSLGLSNHQVFAPMASPPVDKEYLLQINNAVGCYDKDSILVEVDATANLRFEYNFSARCSGAILEINNTSTNTDEFVWTVNGTFMSNDFEPSFDLDFSKSNEIILSGKNTLCADSVVKIIPPHTFDEVVELNKVNVFSPNGDGINDIFNAGLDGEFIGCAEFIIFNRSGSRVFHSNIGDHGWDGRTMDGKRAPGGTYFYILKIAGKEIKGSVYLSR